ncbi:Panacea domain-containing protein [Janibacter sp. G368]|uniref:Panacea domain-containing protein n=1 Tax=Janibacter sp. G368 TaxID=3420441 RepID=UPI003D02CA20
MTATAVDVASYIIAEQGEMSAMKLQKLVYYSQAWSLALEGEPLFFDMIEAWANGPVVRSLFGYHRGRYQVTEATFPGDATKLTSQQSALVDEVLDVYSGNTATQLSDLTHAEMPWQAARGSLPVGASSNAVISHESMQTFYRAVLDEAAAHTNA